MLILVGFKIIMVKILFLFFLFWYLYFIFEEEVCFSFGVCLVLVFCGILFVGCMWMWFFWVLCLILFFWFIILFFDVVLKDLIWYKDDFLFLVGLVIGVGDVLWCGWGWEGMLFFWGWNLCFLCFFGWGLFLKDLDFVWCFDFFFKVFGDKNCLLWFIVFIFLCCWC